MIQFLEVRFHNRLDLVQSHTFGECLIGEHQRNQFTFAFNNERFAYCLLVIEFVLNLLGVDILSRSTKEHGLATSFDVDILLFIQTSEVTGTHPSVFGEDSFGSFWVLIITHHDVLAFDEDLTDTGFVGVVNLHLHIHHRCTTGTSLEVLRRITSDERRTLGHSVADREREMDVHQTFLHNGVDGSTAADKVP